jgi:Na+/H+ antiporter NhaD/arsenite permease-like protein
MKSMKVNFVGLFVLVGGLEVTGFVGSIAEALTGLGGGGSVTTVVVIWGSGLASGLVTTSSSRPP